jgi:hypothetical protein
MVHWGKNSRAQNILCNQQTGYILMQNIKMYYLIGYTISNLTAYTNITNAFGFQGYDSEYLMKWEIAFCLTLSNFATIEALYALVGTWIREQYDIPTLCILYIPIHLYSWFTVQESDTVLFPTYANVSVYCLQPSQITIRFAYFSITTPFIIN